MVLHFNSRNTDNVRSNRALQCKGAQKPNRCEVLTSQKSTKNENECACEVVVANHRRGLNFILPLPWKENDVAST
jgi:hypothetical protein